jgi:hypothetical protein
LSKCQNGTYIRRQLLSSKFFPIHHHSCIICGNLLQYKTKIFHSVPRAGDIYTLQLAAWPSGNPHKGYPTSAHSWNSNVH